MWRFQRASQLRCTVLLVSPVSTLQCFSNLICSLTVFECTYRCLEIWRQEGCRLQIVCRARDRCALVHIEHHFDSRRHTRLYASRRISRSLSALICSDCPANHVCLSRPYPISCGHWAGSRPTCCEIDYDYQATSRARFTLMVGSEGAATRGPTDADLGQRRTRSRADI